MSKKTLEELNAEMTELQERERKLFQELAKTYNEEKVKKVASVVEDLKKLEWTFYDGTLTAEVDTLDLPDELFGRTGNLHIIAEYDEKHILVSRAKEGKYSLEDELKFFKDEGFNFDTSEQLVFVENALKKMLADVETLKKYQTK